MRGVFDDREIQKVEARHDTELTLGSTTLLLLFFGLVLLCGACFGLGYATGHRGAPDAGTLVPPASGTNPEPADSGRLKPTANEQASAAGAQPAPAANDPLPGGSSPADVSVQSAAVAAASEPSGGSNGFNDSNGAQQVKPALGSTATPLQAPTPPVSAVNPAVDVPGSLMVQIAAVSEQEDADVLMGALRKRGYEVAARREPLDGLIHVRIGPFKTRDDAEKWRQKLLNDGYNAIVQP
jgi:cell division septation protein DedD